MLFHRCSLFQAKRECECECGGRGAGSGDDGWVWAWVRGRGLTLEQGRICVYLVSMMRLSSVDWYSECLCRHVDGSKKDLSGKKSLVTANYTNYDIWQVV